MKEIDEYAQTLREAYFSGLQGGPNQTWSDTGEWLKDRWRDVARKAIESRTTLNET